MKIGFEKPVGSHADVKELEYISALHQTCHPLRRNGSIARLVLSRFGIEANVDSVEEEIITDLGGDPQAEPRGILDLRQVVQILLIPHLVRIKKTNPYSKDKGVRIKEIVQEIKEDMKRHAIHDVVNSNNNNDWGRDNNYEEDENDSANENDDKLFLTRKMIKQLFQFYADENDISEQVITKMLEVAGGEGVELNTRTLIKAMTADLEGYDPEWETQVTTSYLDILGAKPALKMGTEGSLLRRSIQALERDGNKINNIIEPRQNGRASKTPTLPTNHEESELSQQKTNQNTKRKSEYYQRIDVPQLQDELEKKAHRVFAFSFVDNTAETYGSQTFAVLLWVAFITLFAAYVYGNETGETHVECDKFRSEFGCQVANAVLGWLGLFAKLFVLGCSFILFGSIGNTVFVLYGWFSILLVLVAMGVVVFFTILPNFIVWEGWFFNTNWETEAEVYQMFGYVAMVWGIMMLILQIKMLVRLILPHTNFHKDSRVSALLAPGAFRKELNTKKAAVFKISNMVENAFSMHATRNEPSDKAGKSAKASNDKAQMPVSYQLQAMTKFLANAYKRESVKNSLWAWKSYLNGSICSEEGVWFHTRLLASVLCQLLLFVSILSLLYYSLFDVSAAYAKARGERTFCVLGHCTIITYLNETVSDIQGTVRNDTEQALSNVTANAEFFVEMEGAIKNLFSKNCGEETADGIVGLSDTIYQIEQFLVEEAGYVYQSVRDYIIEATQDPVDALIDWLVQNAEESQVKFAIGIGTTFALLATLWTLYGTIPAFIFNVMKFRYGVQPTLSSADFEMYRFAPDHATLVFGMVFWGRLFTSFFAFVVTGAIAFFCVWEHSQPYVGKLVAQLVGISVTLLIKVIVLRSVRYLFFDGFYRKQLAGANLLYVVLECWNVALSTGFLFARSIIFFFMAIFYLGRIDIPFLGHGVDRFDNIPLYLDGAPVNYRKDLLQHEAHRHPYLDRLAAMYLLKLNLGEAFGTRAGSCWRLLYALALMPWLRQYRVSSLDDEPGEQDIDGQMAFHPAVQQDARFGGLERGTAEREIALEEEVTRLRAETARMSTEMRQLRRRISVHNGVVSV